MVLCSHKPNSIWESCFAVASELERKQACKNLLGYSPPPMDGHKTSLTDISTGSSVLSCFEDQLPNLWWLLLGASSLLRGREIHCTPHHIAGELYPGFQAAPPSGLPCWDPCPRAHISRGHGPLVAFLRLRLPGTARCSTPALTPCPRRVRCRIHALSRLSIWKQTLAKSYTLLFKVSQFVFILLATFTSCSELCLKLKGRGNVQQEKIIHW